MVWRHIGSILYKVTHAFHVTHAFVYVNVKVFEREVRREKILESRHKELKLKMKQQAAAAAATGGPSGGGGGGEG